MTTELTCLAWMIVLALVQILLPGMLRTRETGVAYNAGARDEAGPPVGRLTGRFNRAERNLLETLPLFAAAVLIATVAGRTGPLTGWGALLYAWGRLLYLPLYAFGVPYLRSLVWVASTFGLVLILLALLR